MKAAHLLFGALPFAAACSLLAPSDHDLMGDPTNALVPGTDGDVTIKPGVDGSAADGVAPGPDGAGTADAGIADTGPPDSPACATCRRISAACLANPQCVCLTADLCAGTSGCSGTGDQSVVSCGNLSCTASTGSIVCVSEGTSCACK